MLKVNCGIKGYFLEIDGLESEPHYYGHACLTAGPSGTLYAACPAGEPEEKGKIQLYKCVPIDSITESGLELDADTDGGFVEDAMYDDEEEGEGEGEGDEVVVEDEGDNDDQDDDEHDEKTSDKKI